MTTSFKDLGLNPELLAALDQLDHVTPTPIQAEAIPPLLTGRDVMGQAQTGTGKTAAFTLPILQQINPEGLQALILTPTRELAIQTADAVYRYGSQMGVRVLPVYGGQPYQRQVRRLRQNSVNVVVGTPGRTLDLIRQEHLDLSTVQFVVLDEADEMLKMGFIDDVESILSATDAHTRQTIVVSATLPQRIQQLVKRYMRDPLLVQIKSAEMTVAKISERYHLVRMSDKVAALCRLLEMEDLKNTLIFARTKAGSADLAEKLQGRGYPAEAIHGDLPQNDRERLLRRFRSGKLTILVATDVVARGVDIPEVSHVINYDIPQLPIEYVHRIGRTGRAGRGGCAITLVTPREHNHLRRIAATTGKAITRSELPTREAIEERRATHFKALIENQTRIYPSDADLALLEELLTEGYTARQIAAATLGMVREQQTRMPVENIREVTDRPARRHDKPMRKKRDRTGKEAGMVRLHMDIGRSKGVRPADIVYSIASEANIPGRVIGAITINQHDTYLDVPEQHVKTVLSSMRRTKIRGCATNLQRA